MFVPISTKIVISARSRRFWYCVTSYQSTQPLSVKSTLSTPFSYLNSSNPHKERSEWEFNEKNHDLRKTSTYPCFWLNLNANLRFPRLSTFWRIPPFTTSSANFLTNLHSAVVRGLSFPHALTMAFSVFSVSYGLLIRGIPPHKKLSFFLRWFLSLYNNALDNESPQRDCEKSEIHGGGGVVVPLSLSLSVSLLSVLLCGRFWKIFKIGNFIREKEESHALDRQIVSRDQKCSIF